MNFLNNHTKFALASLTLVVTNSALAATLDPATAPNTYASDIPTTDYVLGNNLAMHSKDGLIWQRCLVGQTLKNGRCTGEATEFDSWEKAMNNSVTAEQAKEGWRVPNIKELMRITDSTKAFPATNSDVFLFAKSLKFTLDTESSFRAQIASPTSPMIWSSTPMSHLKITSKNFNDISEAESLIETDKERVKANKVYALSLDYGNFKYAYRDGRSKGEVEGQYSGDTDGVVKARYVLLVKDNNLTKK